MEILAVELHGLQAEGLEVVLTGFQTSQMSYLGPAAATRRRGFQRYQGLA